MIDSSLRTFRAITVPPAGITATIPEKGTTVLFVTALAATAPFVDTFTVTFVTKLSDGTTYSTSRRFEMFSSPFCAARSDLAKGDAAR